MIEKKIGIIGCGNMGEALLARLSTVMEKSTRIMVSELNAARCDYIQTKYKMMVEIDNNYLVKHSDVIILAVKPKDFEEVLNAEVCCGVSKEKLLISIAAGITTRHIESVVGKDAHVIRVMPNMPAVIGQAISAISRGSSATDADVKLAKEIFSLIGDVIEVNEELVNAVTAISGSGPAYFFYMIESLIEAAQELGLDRETASRLVVKTVLGSSRLLETLKEDPAALRARIASKGGTTEAALEVFESKKFKAIIKDAVKQACAKAKALSGG